MKVGKGALLRKVLIRKVNYDIICIEVKITYSPLIDKFLDFAKQLGLQNCLFLPKIQT